MILPSEYDQRLIDQVAKHYETACNEAAAYLEQYNPSGVKRFRVPTREEVTRAMRFAPIAWVTSIEFGDEEEWVLQLGWMIRCLQAAMNENDPGHI